MGSGINYKEYCMGINIDGMPQNISSDVKYLGISFVAVVKLKVSLTQKRIKFCRAFNIWLALAPQGVSKRNLC